MAVPGGPEDHAGNLGDEPLQPGHAEGQRKPVIAMSLRHRVLEYLRSRLADDPLPLRLIFWDGKSFDFAATPSVTITLHSSDLPRMLLRGDFARLGDAYVAGDLTVEGPIEDILRTGITLAERIGKSSTLNRWSRLGRFVPRRHSRRQDAADISYHYDVGNDFYRLWLDEYLIYSCAYFRSGTEDIDTAQRQKLDHICRKLMLKPGERLLDLGCGWGGLLHWAAQHYAVTGVGITLSERQYASARQSLAAARLSDKVEIRLMDYRDLNELKSYDKIVSVGMYEHVGLRNLPLYFATVGQAAAAGWRVPQPRHRGDRSRRRGARTRRRRIYRSLRVSRRRPAAPVANHFRSGTRRPGVRRRRGLASALCAHAAALDASPGSSA